MRSRSRQCLNDTHHGYSGGASVRRSGIISQQMATTFRPRAARTGGSSGSGPVRGDSAVVRIRRVAVVASLLVLVVAVIAYANAMSGPSNTALGVRSVEWLRDNGAASIVATVENWYYSLTAPSKGGPTLRSLPQVGDAAAARRTTPAATTTPA